MENIEQMTETENASKKKKEEEIVTSKQFAKKIKKQWDTLNQKGSGKSSASNKEIRGVDISEKQDGKAEVRLETQNGSIVLDGTKEENITEQDTLSELERAKVRDFMKKIREYGYAAVEGEIPADLKDDVLREMASENISTSYQGRIAEEREAAEKRYAEAAENMAKAAATAAMAIDTSGRNALSEAYDKIAENHKDILKNISVTSSSLKGAHSFVEAITVTHPDGSTASYTISGKDKIENRKKVEEISCLLWRKENGQKMTPEDEKLLAELEKKGVTSLEDFHKKSNCVNNISYKLFSNGVNAIHKDSVHEEKAFDIQHQKKLNEEKRKKVAETLEKKAHGQTTSEDEKLLSKLKKMGINSLEDFQNNPNCVNNISIQYYRQKKTLDISVGQNISDLIETSRNNRSDGVERKEDCRRLQYLKALSIISGEETVTKNMLKTAKQLQEEKINIGELYKIAKDESLSSEQKMAKLGRLAPKKNAPHQQKSNSSAQASNEQREQAKAEKERLLDPNNKESQAKIAQVRFLLKKEEQNQELTDAEKDLLRFVHRTYEKKSHPEPLSANEDLSKDPKALFEMLRNKKYFGAVRREHEQVKKNNASAYTPAPTPAPAPEKTVETAQRKPSAKPAGLQAQITSHYIPSEDKQQQNSDVQKVKVIRENTENKR